MSNIWKHWRRAISRSRREVAASASVTAAEATGTCCDDEQLAAFLDGRLDERERSLMIAHLADTDDAYEVFACTAAVLAEGDALLARMQTPEARSATRRAFAASPDYLRKAAIEAARSSDG